MAKKIKFSQIKQAVINLKTCSVADVGYAEINHIIEKLLYGPDGNTIPHVVLRHETLEQSFFPADEESRFLPALVRFPPDEKTNSGTSSAPTAVRSLTQNLLTKRRQSQVSR